MSVWICVRKLCTRFAELIFILSIMQLQKLLLWMWVFVDASDKQPTASLSVLWTNYAQIIPFLIIAPCTFCTSRQEEEIKAQSSRWTACLSCGLSVWCSVWRSLPFCVLGHRLEQTVELLCLPTDISELALLCLGRLLQYTEECGRNSYSATWEADKFSQIVETVQTLQMYPTIMIGWPLSNVVCLCTGTLRPVAGH